MKTKATAKWYEQAKVRDCVEFWTFKGVIVNQQYPISAGVNLDRAVSVVIYRKSFQAVFVVLSSQHPQANHAALEFRHP